MVNQKLFRKVSKVSQIIMFSISLCKKLYTWPPKCVQHHKGKKTVIVQRASRRFTSQRVAGLASAHVRRGTNLFFNGLASIEFGYLLTNNSLSYLNIHIYIYIYVKDLESIFTYLHLDFLAIPVCSRLIKAIYLLVLFLLNAH